MSTRLLVQSAAPTTSPLAQPKPNPVPFFLARNHNHMLTGSLSSNSHGPEDRHRDPPACRRHCFCQGCSRPTDRVLCRVHHTHLIRGKRNLREGSQEDHRLRPHHQGPGAARFRRVRPRCFGGCLGAQGTAKGEKRPTSCHGPGLRPLQHDG